MAARYGAPMSRRTKIVLVVAFAPLVLLAAAWFLWVSIYHATPPVRSTLLGYEVTSDRTVEVRFEVWREANVSAECVIRARNAEGVEVGRRVITIPPGERHVVLTSVLETRGRAINGELQRCREAATG